MNPQVTEFLDQKNHPLRELIDQLRHLILISDANLSENIKWNGPNYHIGDNDRITMRIHPPTQVQLIFHRGAKVQAAPESKLIDDASGLLLWKGNDRAIASFKSLSEMEQSRSELVSIVKAWIMATT